MLDCAARNSPVSCLVRIRGSGAEFYLIIFSLHARPFCLPRSRTQPVPIVRTKSRNTRPRVTLAETITLQMPHKRHLLCRWDVQATHLVSSFSRSEPVVTSST